MTSSSDFLSPHRHR